MCTYTATYSPDDNKIRLSCSQRLDPETYARVKAAGFIWAPKQEQFIAPMWTPQRADLCIELAGEIEDDDGSLIDRAEARAERFGEYSEKRSAEANRARDSVARIMDGIPLGQPILIGHHSQRHAERDAKRIEAGMQKAVDLWDTSKYWKRRAAAALAHAKYKERADVRARRIKGLEADERKHRKTIDEAERLARVWAKIPRIEWDRQTAAARYLAGRSESIACAALPGSAWPTSSLYSELEAGRMHGDTAWRLALESFARRIEWAGRWLEHITGRLEYERAMLDEGGGLVADRHDIQPGGRVLIGSEWVVVLRVNRREGKVTSMRTTCKVCPQRNVEEVKGYREPEADDVAKVKAATTKAPLCNYPGEGFHHMTKAAYDAVHKDYKGTATVGGNHPMRDRGAPPLAEGLAPHRVRSVMAKAAGLKSYGLLNVFLTDAPKKEAPRLDDVKKKPAGIAAAAPWNKDREPDAAPLPGTPVRFERIPAEGADAPKPRTWAQPERTEFDAMRDSLKAGVLTVSAPQLFPTPPGLAARMVAMADPKPGERVAEPEAGTGRILEALAAAVPLDRLEVAAWEISRELAGQLQARFPSVFVQAGDFLETEQTAPVPFDVILMNPPFAGGADVEHVTHAAGMLAPGGRLVAILSAGVTFREDRKTRDFRRLVADMGGEFEELPADTFASSGTGVRTVLVMLRRPPLPVADRVAELMATPGADVQLVAGVVSAEVARSLPAIEPNREQVAAIVATCVRRRVEWAAPGLPSAEDWARELATLAAGAAELRRQGVEHAGTAAAYDAAAVHLRDLAAAGEALQMVGRMSSVDCFDYLADHGEEPPADEREPDQLRAALLASIARTGPAVFVERMTADA